jgi:hypothetical protein
MQRLAKSAIVEFLAQRPFSVVHIDGDWDGYVDCDVEQEYAREIGIVNVPSVAYYSGTRLCVVVIGMQQDVARNIQRLMRGEPLDHTNKLSRG